MYPYATIKLGESEMTDKKSSESRRKLLKSIAAGSGAIVAGKSLPESWSRPVVDSVMLPAHAQTSPTCTDTPIAGMRTSLDLLTGGAASFSINNYLGGDQAFSGSWSGPDSSRVVTINETRTISGCTVTAVVNATVDATTIASPILTSMSWSVESTCPDGNICTSSGTGFAVVGDPFVDDDEIFFDVCNSGTECCTLNGLLPTNDESCSAP
jgi:hypothetical protein